MEIYVAGSAPAIDRTRATAEELFNRLGVAVDVIPEYETRIDEPAFEPPVVVVHVDLSSPFEPRLLVLDGPSGSELTRRVLPSTNSLETSVEAVTHIAYLIVESLLEQQPATAETPPEPEPAPPARPTAPRPRPLRPTTAPPPRKAFVPRRTAPGAAVSLGLDAGLALGVTRFGADRTLPGAGPALEARCSRGRHSFGILGAGAVHTATQVVLRDAIVDLRPVTLRLLATYDHALQPNLSLVTGAGGGLDTYGIEPHRSGTHVRVRTGGSAIDPVLGALFGVRAQLVGATFLTAAAAVDVDLVPSRFVALIEDAPTQSVLEVPRVRPTLWVTVSGSLTRPSRFPQPGARP